MLYPKKQGGRETEPARRQNMDNSTLKTLVLLGVILYVVSPVDALPGPVDDLIAIVAGIIARRKLSAQAA